MTVDTHCQEGAVDVSTIRSKPERNIRNQHHKYALGTLLRRDKGIDTDNVTLDPTLPELKLGAGAFGKWIGMMDDVDETCMQTVAAFQNHPLIPDDVVVSGWVWEVETRRLRAPTSDPDKRARTDVTAAQFGVAAKQPARWSHSLA